MKYQSSVVASVVYMHNLSGTKRANNDSKDRTSPSVNAATRSDGTQHVCMRVRKYVSKYFNKHDKHTCDIE